MPRISKAPEIRKREIIDAAMRLFAQNGYEHTSIADIAGEMQVVPGLIYRYFASKQELFDIALRQYAEESCRPFLGTLRDRSLAVEQLFDRLMNQMTDVEHHSRYSDFYHKPENKTFHLQLAVEMSGIMAPYLEAEVTRLCELGLMEEEHPRLLVEFILSGMLSLWTGTQAMPFDERVRKTAVYVRRLLGLAESGV